MEKYNIVQVGAGHQSYMHATAIGNAGVNGNAYNIVGVTDLREHEANHLAHRISELHPPIISADVIMCIQQVLQKVKSCIPVVCTSVKAHEPLGNLIAHHFDRHQIPGVIFEKPFGGCPEAGQRLHTLFTEKGMIIGVQEQMYYSRVLQEVQQVLSSPEAFLQCFDSILGGSITADDLKIREILVNFSKNRRNRTFQFPTPNLFPPEWLYFEGPHLLAIVDMFMNGLGKLIHVEGKHMESPLADTRSGWATDHPDFVSHPDNIARVPFHGGGSMDMVIGNAKARILSDMTTDHRCRSVELKLGKDMVLTGYLDAGNDNAKDTQKREGYFELLKNGISVKKIGPFEDNSLANSLTTLAADIHHGRIPLSSAERNIALGARQKDGKDWLYR